MTRIRWVATGVAVVVVAVVIVLAASLGKSTSGANVLVGKAAPAFTLKSLHGGTQIRSATELPGKVTVVNFWNDWCIPCQQEQPALAALNQRHAGDPKFAFLGVVHDERSMGAIEQYVKDNKIGYPLATDAGSRMALDYGVTGQPETFVIDGNGVVRNWISGPIDAQKLNTLVNELESEIQ
jgi:cytochrome c biogenesis protein CcmG/thiol:disulfide interchange protein DsbE